MQFREQFRKLGDINAQIVAGDLQIGIFSLQVVCLQRHAEEIDQIIPFVDQIDIYAAAHFFAGGVDGPVIHAGAPVRQITGTDCPCTEGPFARMFVQIILGFHEDLAPAHRCSHIGLLTGVGDLADRSVDLIPGNDGLLDKERTGTVFYLFQRLLVERGGIRDECDVIERKRVIVIQVQQLVLKQFFDAGTKRDPQVMAQGVHIEFDAPVLTDMVQIAQVAGPDGTQSDE